MDRLFDLIFWLNEVDHEEEFHIGLFAEREEAEAAAERYLRDVPGFKDYDCVPRVLEIPLIGAGAQTKEVFQYLGWNTDEDLNETDVLISSCFADPVEAEEALTSSKQRMPREEWVLNRHVIGQCDWTEGFERVWCTRRAKNDHYERGI